MTDQSRFLRYLPPVLEAAAETNQLPLGDLLRVFEKILTGVDDSERMLHLPAGETEDHPHEALKQVIDNLYRLFDPWSIQPDVLPWLTSYPDFLSWLASWVALDFPTLQGKPLWDEYQQRRAVADMASVYKQRGLKAGLKHLSLIHI